MPEIESIVGAINTNLSTGQFKASRFQTGQMLGLVEAITIDEETKQTTVLSIDSDGNVGDYALLEDKSPFKLYHRIKDIESSIVSGKGNKNNIQEITTSLIMVVMYDIQKINYKKEEIAQAAVLGIPTQFSLGVDGIEYTETQFGNINLDKDQIWTEETRSETPVPLPYYIVAIEYQIVQQVDANCYNLCPTT